jgi:hypothetical protein
VFVLFHSFVISKMPHPNVHPNWRLISVSVMVMFSCKSPLSSTNENWSSCYAFNGGHFAYKLTIIHISSKKSYWLKVSSL